MGTKTRKIDGTPQGTVRARYDWRTAGPRVSTPRGVGTLWQRFECRAGVVLDAEAARVTFLDPEDVSPPFRGRGPKSSLLERGPS
jgi:hypothetical protein